MKHGTIINIRLFTWVVVKLSYLNLYRNIKLILRKLNKN